MNKESVKKLQEVGFLAAEDGTIFLLGSAREMFDGWLRFLPLLLRPYYETSLIAPAFSSKKLLGQSGYLKNFPQQLFKISKERFLTPAACLHFYDLQKNNPLESGLVLAECARVENETWSFPFRLSHFHMMELVAIGSPEYIERNRAAVQSLIDKTFKRLGIKGKFETATDAFFLGEKEGAKIIQKLKGLKQEFQGNLGSTSVALASVNNHEDYFSKRFGIKNKKGSTFSFCAAFGIERLTACGLLTWGTNKKNWPKELRV